MLCIISLLVTCNVSKLPVQTTPPTLKTTWLIQSQTSQYVSCVMEELLRVISTSPRVRLVSSETSSMLNLAKGSITTINRQTLPVVCRKISEEVSKSHWEGKLQSLCVQGKFHQICSLESHNNVWNGIMQGLPSGQLTFVL